MFFDLNAVMRLASFASGLGSLWGGYFLHERPSSDYSPPLLQFHPHGGDFAHLRAKTNKTKFLSVFSEIMTNAFLSAFSALHPTVPRRTPLRSAARKYFTNRLTGPRCDAVAQLSCRP
jgi:hypothetical protein